MEMPQVSFGCWTLWGGCWMFFMRLLENTMALGNFEISLLFGKMGELFPTKNESGSSFKQQEQREVLMAISTPVWAFLFPLVLTPELLSRARLRGQQGTPRDQGWPRHSFTLRSLLPPRAGMQGLKVFTSWGLAK